MNVFNSVIFFLFSAFFILSCGSKESVDENSLSKVSAENLTSVNYAIDGMVCAMGCAATIEKEIAEVSGIVSSNVNYELGKAHFEFDESIVSEEEIVSKIENIAEGQYKVQKWVENSAADQVEESESKNEENISEISLSNFKVPNLLILLLDRV